MSCVYVSTMSCVYFVNYVPDSFKLGSSRVTRNVTNAAEWAIRIGAKESQKKQLLVNDTQEYRVVLDL
jgi:hypothetical protein